MFILCVVGNVSKLFVFSGGASPSPTGIINDNVRPLWYLHHKLKIQTVLGASYLPQGRLCSAEHLSRALLFKSVRQTGIQGNSLGLFSLVRFFGKDQRNEQSTYIKSSLCVDEPTNIHLNRLTLFFFDSTRRKEKVPRKLGCKNFQFLFALQKKKRRFARALPLHPASFWKSSTKTFLANSD